MVFLLPVRQHLYIESGPCILKDYFIAICTNMIARVTLKQPSWIWVYGIRECSKIYQYNHKTRPKNNLCVFNWIHCSIMQPVNVTQSHIPIYPVTYNRRLFQCIVSEWVIISLFLDSGHWGPCSPNKQCNHNLYIGIIIFPHIDNTQSTGYNWIKKNG